MKTMRILLLVIGAFQSILALAFFLRMPMALSLWPLPGTTPLTFILVSSIFAAAAASTLWAAGSGNLGALAGIGLDYVAIFTPVSIFLVHLGTGSGDARTTNAAVGCGLAALFGVGVFRWSVRHAIDTSVRVPPLVRWSFGFFIVALLIVSIRLIMQFPTIPWQLTPALSIVIGWMFIGAATYFAYALLRPSWRNATGQLIGFLAYDIVLIVPFIERLPTVAPEHRTGLIVYTAVVIYSALLALYFLFVHRGTRLWNAPAGAAP